MQAWGIMTSLGAMIRSPLHKAPSPSVLTLAGSPALLSQAARRSGHGSPEEGAMDESLSGLFFISAY